ncbi:MAG: hypothetical protein J6O73_02915 [Lachnospiraceae bacterium]|nr:hypothetical protein [Lachnospiraceae bacterium]
MNDYTCKSPVAMIFFNRPDTTKEVLDAIRVAKPSKMYLISDAPRAGRADDEEKVTACRKLVEEGIDWPCEVHKNYAESNMGCRDRVASGISWVLSQENCTIILEDDVVPAPDFFPYMDTMLEAYKDNPKVMMVSGTNLLKNYSMDKPYIFSCFSSIWGWGTWARAWEKYDVDVKSWPEVKKSGRLMGIHGRFSYMFLKKDIESVYTHAKDTWDIQWDYCRHMNRGLGIVPRANLIRNIGFDREDATHTTGSTAEDFSYGIIEFPLPVEKVIRRDLEYDRAYINKYFGLNKVINFVKKKCHRGQF